MKFYYSSFNLIYVIKYTCNSLFCKDLFIFYSLHTKMMEWLNTEYVYIFLKNKLLLFLNMQFLLPSDFYTLSKRIHIFLIWPSKHIKKLKNRRRRAENTMADRSSDQMRHNDLQNATQTTEDCATRTTLETGDYCRCYRRVLAVPIPLVAERTRK
jgi:hypothetical protein